ncbi:MAG: WecB/TagA/CpsF family glycosyltransferase [Candidatus Gracilibacteria bacterium]|nr:WecB/TagA/CpsF family glycosyltransferase [Candidatus Gracilibacteria bacterium]
MQIFGLNLNQVVYKDFFGQIRETDKKLKIFTPNPEILLAMKKDKEFAEILKFGDYLLPDGTGLYIAFQILDNDFGKLANILLLPYFFFNFFFRRKMLYIKYGEKVCGSDLTRDLLEFAEKNSKEITILDLYNPTDLKKVASQEIFLPRLQEKFPNTKINFLIYKEEEKELVLKKINESKSIYLFVTLGLKKQEKLINELFKEINIPIVGLGIGSSFDYLIGFQKRAPKAFRTLGLEWFYRLLTGPQKVKRLKRIHNAIFGFIGEVLKEK